MSIVWTFWAFAGAAMVQEDLACLSAGLLIGRGEIATAPAILGCLVGTFTADLVWCFAARLLGRWILRHPPLSWIVSETNLVRCAQWINLRGGVLVFASRFLAGIRIPLMVSIGMFYAKTGRIVLALFLAGTLYVGCLVGAAAWLGELASTYLAVAKSYQPLIIVSVGALLWLAVRLGRYFLEMHFALMPVSSREPDSPTRDL